MIMKIEEQIKQAANEYATTQGGLLTEKALNAFIAGANFGREIGMKEAFEWRDTSDNPPTVKDEGYHIICKDEDNTLAFEYILSQSDCDDLHRYWSKWKPLELEDMP